MLRHPEKHTHRSADARQLGRVSWCKSGKRRPRQNQRIKKSSKLQLFHTNINKKLFLSSSLFLYVFGRSVNKKRDSRRPILRMFPSPAVGEKVKPEAIKLIKRERHPQQQRKEGVHANPCH